MLYTDGLVEARNRAGKIFGEGLLTAALTHSAVLRPAEAVESIIASGKQWAPSQDDDLTILICDCMLA